MLIKDIVDLDEKAEFRSDVQLSAYDDRDRNLALLHSYLFSTSTQQRDLSAAGNTSPVDLLSELVNAFYSVQAENRQVVIADYGHGKTHLALALANYFGRPADSPELAVIRRKLEQALNDPARAGRYRDFKDSKGAFLLLRVRGDIPERLPAQFFSALERGLAEHEATAGIKLPFWYERAEEYLKNMSREAKAKANDYLARHDSEIPLLLQEIRAHHDVVDLAIGAIHAGTGIRPELRETGLAAAIDWAVGELVGPGKPFGGLLVLFDEFTLYLNKYARRHAAANLQDLLNGIDNHRGKAAFVAFAQVDPETTAENMTIAGNERADLKKALTRLPRKHRLHSLLESVIDAYLLQSQPAWEKFIEPMSVRGKLTGASDVAYNSFSRRYDRALRWTPTKFQETITKGCFPLHPITTVLLCNMRLETVDTGVPRTVLGFVMTNLRAKQTEPALVDGRPNWVLPIALVDYFEDSLVGNAYDSFKNARRAVGAEMTIEQEAILKALLLYELGDVRVRAHDQFDFLCQASGLERQVAGNALRELVAANAIRQDGSSRMYSLWPMMADPQRMERLIREKLKEMRFDERSLQELNKEIDEVPGVQFGLQPMNVAWGHQTDWGAREEIITVESLTAADLRERVALTKFGPNGAIQEGARGYVFWGLARDDEERAHFRENAERVLDEAFPGDSPVPVLLVLPNSPQPGLIDNFMRRNALRAFKSPERQDVGKEMFEHEERRVIAEIGKALLSIRGAAERPYDILRSSDSLAVPVAYRAAVKQLGEANLNQAVLECYRLAYRWRPPTFDTRYQVSSRGSNALRTASVRIASNFFKNKSKSLASTIQSERFTVDLYDRHLKKAWGVLGPDYRLQKPREAGVAAAWNLIDNFFAPGRSGGKLSDVIIELLNPPFGYDYNTAVLIFAAWYGFNSADVRVSSKGSFAFEAGDAFNQWLEKGTKDFVRLVHENAVALSRREPGDMEKELHAQLAAYRDKQHTPDDAIKLAGNIQALAADERIAEGLRNQAAEASRELNEAAEAAQTYDREATDVAKLMRQGNVLSNLKTIQNKLAKLAPPTLVTTNTPPLQALHDELTQAVQTAASQVASTYSKLTDVGRYALHQQYLTNGRKAVADAGYTPLATIFDGALAELEKQREKLAAQEGEKSTRAALEIMRTDIPLSGLYEQRDYLETLTVYSDVTVALRDKKLAATRQEIDRLEHAAESFHAEALTHPDQASLIKAYNRLVSSMSRYDGSPPADKMAESKHLMERYGSFLNKLTEIRQSIPGVQSEESAKESLMMLDQLAAANGEWLSERQQKLLAQTRQEVHAHRETKRKEAAEWLARVIAAGRANGDPVRLLQTLQKAPAFLSEEQQAQVREQVDTVERRIDEDALMQIEQQFRSLRDPEMQRACLARLQQLVSQGEIGVREPGGR